MATKLQRLRLHAVSRSLPPDPICVRCLHLSVKSQLSVVGRQRGLSSAVSLPGRKLLGKGFFQPSRILDSASERTGNVKTRQAVFNGGGGVTTSANVGMTRPTSTSRTQSSQKAHISSSSSSPSEAPEAQPILEEPAIPLDASSKLSALSSTLPKQSFRRLFTSYLSLSKPRLTFLIVLTATSAYSLYPVPELLLPTATSTPSLSALTLLFLTSGTALASASANALNMLFEPAHDAKMSRTRNRPIVRGLIGARGAILFAVVTGVLGIGSLYIGTNPTVAGLGALNIFLYAGLYTPLKRVSVLNTWVGALVGAIPPLMGWTAAAGQSASEEGGWNELLLGEGSAGGWLLAALLYAWQFPHFNALSHTIKDEYRNAGYRMLAWVNPKMNGRVAFRYALAMFPICGGLCLVGVTDWGYLVTSSVVNGWVARDAWRFWRRGGAGGSARSLFWSCIWHLPGVMVLAMVHKQGLWAGLWRSLNGELEKGTGARDAEDVELEAVSPATVNQKG
ncbi:MAG: Protoheme IX farnesyltransferase, mitochondrial [Vezdaea aestivalis]|nr:MAG: Protoheme IX farnesyltransferase, mitochondrial [Vezdaea aestivalis]